MNVTVYWNEFRGLEKVVFLIAESHRKHGPTLNTIWWQKNTLGTHLNSPGYSTKRLGVEMSKGFFWLEIYEILQHPLQSTKCYGRSHGHNGIEWASDVHITSMYVYVPGSVFTNGYNRYLENSVFSFLGTKCSCSQKNTFWVIFTRQFWARGGVMDKPP